MKKLFKYEINESIAAKAAMNCCKKRMLKELYALGSPMPQEEVANGEYDPYEWEFDDYGNEDKRQLVIQALVQAGLIQSEQEGLSLNNKIQQIMDKTGFSVSNEQDAMKFVKSYGQQIVGETQEQEETDYTNDDIPSYHFSYQNSFLVWAMRHVIPYLKEMSKICAQADPTELKHAVMKVLKEEGRFGAPESEGGCEDWAETKRWKVEEFLGGSTQEQEEMEVTDAKHVLAELAAELLHYEDGDLDELYYVISDIIDSEEYCPQSDEYDEWIEEHVNEIEDLIMGNQEQEEDYSNDSQGIEMIIDLMVANHMISDGTRTRQIAKELIERKLNEEGMWIGDDKAKAEEFVSLFGEDLEEEIAYWRW